MKFLKFIPLQLLFIVAIGATLYFYLSNHGFKLWNPEIYHPYRKLILIAAGVIIVITCVIFFLGSKGPKEKDQTSERG